MLKFQRIIMKIGKNEIFSPKVELDPEAKKEGTNQPRRSI